MSKILTSEEKKYLQRICRYLGSLGMNHGSIDFEMEYGEFDTNDYNWNRITHLHPQCANHSILPLSQRI